MLHSYFFSSSAQNNHGNSFNLLELLPHRLSVYYFCRSRRGAKTALIPRVKSVQIVDTKHTGSDAVLHWVHVHRRSVQSAMGVFYTCECRKQTQVWVSAEEEMSVLCGFVLSVWRLKGKAYDWDARMKSF